MKKLFLLTVLCLMALLAFAERQFDEDIAIKVQIKGENVTIDLNLVVPATQQQAWAVMTDFEHMASFISNLKESKIIGASENMQTIFQRGSANYGPLSFSFESTREIRLSPFNEIQSRMIKGNMRKMEGTTRFVSEGALTRIAYHADSISGVWIPPIIGRRFIEHEIREQFLEMRNEILKRKNAPNPG